MAGSKPVLPDFAPDLSQQRPVTQEPSPIKKWAFSFQFWREIEFFGLGTSKAGWFASLLERLRILSEKDIDDFMGDSRERDSWRYHRINWNQTNIPVQRSDLSWIDEDYLDNEDEFPLVQLQVSQAMGRIVGFFDQNSIFNIVLLDPLHNMQPSKDFSYRVDPCDPLGCDYSRFLCGLDDILTSRCDADKCETATHIRSIGDGRDSLRDSNVFFIRIPDDYFELAEQALKHKDYQDVGEIFIAGLDKATEPKE